MLVPHKYPPGYILAVFRGLHCVRPCHLETLLLSSTAVRARDSFFEVVHVIAASVWSAVNCFTAGHAPAGVRACVRLVYAIDQALNNSDVQFKKWLNNGGAGLTHMLRSPVVRLSCGL